MTKHLEIHGEKKYACDVVSSFTYLDMLHTLLSLTYLLTVLRDYISDKVPVG